MDEFGVLTERLGLKPQGKAAPMAASKRPVNSNNAQSWNLGFDSDVNPNSSSFLDDQNGFFQSSNDKKTQNNGRSNDFDDIFGGPVSFRKQSGSLGRGGSSFDYDSFFGGSSSNVNTSSIDTYDNDDIFGGMPGLNSSTSANNDAKSDDIFGSFASPPMPSSPVDDLLGDFVGSTIQPKVSNRNKSGNAVNQASSFDDLIPGFGPSVPPNKGRNSSTFMSSEDPFVVLESSTTSTSENTYASSDLLDPLEKISKLNNSVGTKPPHLKSPPKGAQILKGHKVKSSNVSSIDELEDFAMGRLQSNTNGRSNLRSSGEWLGTSANRTSSNSGDDLESFFSVSHRSNSVPRSRTTTQDPIFDSQTNNRGGPQPGVPQRKSSGTSPSMKKSTSANGIFDDLSSMFGEAQIVGKFQEVEGESEERRNARFGRLQRTHERMTKALADMNRRDFQSQQEQEERRRIAESLDVEIKRWAAGKEGNMRALLSSLQFVLWPECGWEPVSLTDMITSASVKKVYRKATLYIHPDKVQQKGATLQHKYTAEKVFDILKEAWNKFSKEELS
ncbi:DnaJ domain containing protein [Parasponia andersonii]|uniref:DnaJ domain containing protein n=1 Tax=Parasponia andersonii TaxID=3476 RepID=A0A2P5DK76_PARAD|nr:DnaJ domain containing protein [Parasponia andersonii]